MNRPGPTPRDIAEVSVAADGVVTRVTPRARELLGFDAELPKQLRALIPGFPGGLWAACGQGSVVSVRSERQDLVVEVVGATRDEMTLAIVARREDDSVDAHIDAVSRVVGELAHEVNNALTGIVAALDTAIEFEELSPGARTLVVKAQSEVLRVASIVSRTRAQSRRGELHVEAVDVLHEIDSLLRPMRGFFDRKQVDVQVEVPDDLAVIHGAALPVLSILTNLLSNARDALTTRGSVLHIRVDRIASDTDGEAPWLVVTVRDDGIGMSREDLLRAGELLFTTKKHGTGIGLATVRAMAASLSGSLLLCSTPDRGTIASVVFPDTHGRPERCSSV